jgi:hypothetical protein
MDDGQKGRFDLEESDKAVEEKIKFCNTLQRKGP